MAKIDNASPQQASTQRRRQKFFKNVVLATRLCISGVVFVTLSFGAVEASRSILRLSPLLFLAGTIQDLGTTELQQQTNWSSNLLTHVSELILVLCLLKKRFFCRFVCPLGLGIDLAAATRRKVFRKKFARLGFVIRSKRPFVFFSIFWLVITEPVFFSQEHVDQSQISALAFDPMSLLSQTLTLAPRGGLIVVVFLLSFILSPFFWRFQFCPCGILQEILYVPKRLFLFIRRRNARSEDRSNPCLPSRRVFFETCAIIGCSALLVALLRKLSGKVQAFFFRPPGALSEEEFLSHCARCGRCVNVCPNKILTLVNFSAEDSVETNNSSQDVAELPLLTKAVLHNTPRIDFHRGKGHCQAECVACGLACPTGAISLKTFEEKAKKPIALARFDAERCMLYYDQECSICRRECPYEAIEFVWSEEEYLNLPQIDEKRCVGCGQCVTKCPGEPILQEYGEYVEAGSQERVKALSIVKRDIP